MKRQHASFSEYAAEILDFARCQRADGSFYGTAGQCRLGKKVGPREIKVLRAKAAAGDAKARRALKKLAGVKDPDAIQAPVKPKKGAVAANSKKEAESKVSTPVKNSADSDNGQILKLLDSTEAKLKTDLDKARKDYDRTESDEASDRVSEALQGLTRIKDDRKAIQDGVLSKPEPKQLTQEQRQRLETRIAATAEKIRNNTATEAERNLYYRLLDMKNAKDPLEMARALRDQAMILKEKATARKKDLELQEQGVSWKERLKLTGEEEIAGRLSANNDRIGYAKMTREERFAKYVVSSGAMKILDTDSDAKQNNAHKNSTAIFSEHGVLGTSRQAQALIAKYNGDQGAVQRGIDDIINFTRNDYRAIRTAVEEGSDSPRAQQAQRINQMLQRMDHPEVTKFRGMNVPDSTLDQMVSSAKSNSGFSDPAPASWSTSGKISMGYTGEAANGRARVLFETVNKTGASVENFGQNGEKELLTPGGTNYRYTGYRVETHEGAPVHVFSVEEQ